MLSIDPASTLVESMYSDKTRTSKRFKQTTGLQQGIIK